MFTVKTYKVDVQAKPRTVFQSREPRDTGTGACSLLHEGWAAEPRGGLGSQVLLLFSPRRFKSENMTDKTPQTLRITQWKVLTRNAFLIKHRLDRNKCILTIFSQTKSDFIVRHLSNGRLPGNIPGADQLAVCTVVRVSPQEVKHCPKKKSILHSHCTLHTSHVWSHYF